MKIQIPNACPCCSSPLERVNDQLFCKNSACPAQLNGKIIHFAKTLGIKGLGPATVAKLEICGIEELFFLDEESLTSQIGSARMAEKLVQEINQARGATLDKVIASFSIPLIGSTAATKLCQTIRHIDEISAETCREAGLGEKATNNLISWYETEFQEIREFLPFDFSNQQKQASEQTNGKTVCITGKLSSFKTKSEAYAALTAAGYKVVESVTKTLDYLVDEGDKGSSKRKKAEELGVTIISNLNNLLKESQ
jgi:DNA ligase (NAD+)